MRRVLFPLSVAVLALAAGAAATLYLHRAAQGALERELHERLLAAGQSATALVSSSAWTQETLRALMESNSLDGAYVLDRELVILASATGPAGRRVDLLRVDRQRVERALTGEANVGVGYDLDGLQVGGGYFPLQLDGGAVLALEAGTAFTGASQAIAHARSVSLGLSLVTALGLALIAWQWLGSERGRRLAAERAARAEALTRVSATAAHEIRNPLGIIRGTVELLRERSGASLGERDRAALEDVLGEVQRLRQLTEDLLDLSADRPMAQSHVELGPLLEELASSVERAFPGVRVARRLEVLPPVSGDAGRLRQVFLNLLQNAAQAVGTGELRLEAFARREGIVVLVRDEGPGVAPEVRARLFEPFNTGRGPGTGLGLALARRLLERHGGTIELLDTPSGTTFRAILPVARR